MSKGLPKGYHSPQMDVEVRLNTNESPWPPPEGFAEQLADEIRRVDLNRYPDREAVRLRESLAARHGVDPSEVFCSNGSNEAIRLLLECRGGPDRRAVVFQPSYSLHSHLAHLTGTEVVSCPRDDRFQLTPALVSEAVVSSSPDVVFLCTPNNPTGTLDPPDVIDAAASGRSLVIVDEAYGEFGGAPSTASRIRADDLAVVRTFSKAWAMAGLRLGYALADRNLVEAMFEAALPYHLDVVKQIAGRIALAYEPELAERVRQITTERDRTQSGLKALGVETWDSSANFILFRPPASAAGVWSGLVEHSVLVRDLSVLPGLEGCLRVTIGTPAENDRFLSALERVLADAAERTS